MIRSAIIVQEGGSQFQRNGVYPRDYLHHAQQLAESLNVDREHGQLGGSQAGFV